MLVYSKKILRFINEIKQAVREILSREVGLKVVADRFYDRFGFHSYPINVVMYNNNDLLGYFAADFYELGFHECLMCSSREQLYNVVRHELAHYIIFITYGQVSTPHSVDFRAFCQRMGWGEAVQRASFVLEKAQTDSQACESDVLRKVKKLLALASSSNVHEAEQAMIKSQQLLLKHHMEASLIEEESEERVVLKRILQQKKMNAKVQAIGRILMTFFVSVVHSRAGEYTYLEILGDLVNVTIAEYVAEVLNQEMDLLWEKAQQSFQVRGIIARNSFFTGLAKGYCDKVQALKRVATGSETTALIVIEQKLVEAKAMVYRRLSSSKSAAHYCQEASLLGEQMGKELHINPAINTTSTKSDPLRLRNF
jgi:hypothetical protein